MLETKKLNRAEGNMYNADEDKNNNPLNPVSSIMPATAEVKMEREIFRIYHP